MLNAFMPVLAAARAKVTPVPGVGEQMANEVKDTVSQAAATAGSILDRMPLLASRLLMSLAILIAGLILLKVGKWIIARFAHRKNRTGGIGPRKGETARSIISSIYSYIMFFAIVASILWVFNVNVTSILAAAGVFGLLLFLFASCQSTINSWISTVLIRNGLAGESEAAMMTSIFWVGTFSGRLLAAWLVGRISPARIVRGCLLIASVNGFVMLFAEKTLPLISVCVFFYGFATGPIIANALAIMKDRGLVSAKVNGFVLACSQFGGMLMPSLFGRIWGDSSSSLFPFVIITLSASLINLAVLRFVVRPEKA